MKKENKKTTYRVRNWKEYNAGLVKRGRLTVWVEEGVAQEWENKEKRGKRGAAERYTDLAIQTMATLGEVYHLPLRANEGLMSSIIEIMKLGLATPDHSTLCRRRKKLVVQLRVKAKQEARHLVVDSTGVKIYGEGEWKVRQHGWSKRRTWRKLHIAVDEETKEIMMALVTENNVDDAEVLSELLDNVVGKISQVSADGAYDKDKAYRTIDKHKATAAIPPRKGAIIHQPRNCKKPPLQRDENLRCIRKIGRKTWKQSINYHRRSLAENSVFRIKMIFGEKVKARSFPAQAAQALLRCAALNTMTHLGMPDSYAA